MAFKFSLATDNDLTSGQSWQASLPRLADASAYWLIVKALVLNVGYRGQGLCARLALCFFLLGRGPWRPRRALPGIVAVLGLVLAGYFFVYVTTPNDLKWQLATSASRLLMHLWPAAILAVFLSLSDPVQLLAERSAAHGKTPARGAARPRPAGSTIAPLCRGRSPLSAVLAGSVVVSQRPWQPDEGKRPLAKESESLDGLPIALERALLCGYTAGKPEGEYRGRTALYLGSFPGQRPLGARGMRAVGGHPLDLRLRAGEFSRHLAANGGVAPSVCPQCLRGAPGAIRTAPAARAQNAAIGLLVDERYADPKLFHPVGRLWLARYALARGPVDWSTDHALVIVDSGVSAPPPAKSRGWILVADLHNGVRLFRTCSAR